MSDVFDPKNEVKSNWFKFGKVGDKISGTLTGTREIPSQLPGKMGEMVRLFEILADSGSYHMLDENKAVIEPAVEIQSGDFYLVSKGPGLDVQMRRAKIGQKVGILFKEVKPSKTKGYNPLKIVKVFLGEMDPDYMGEGADDQGSEEE